MKPPTKVTETKQWGQKGKRKNSRVDKKKKQNGRENEEARGRKDKVGGEEKMKGLFMSGL